MGHTYDQKLPHFKNFSEKIDNNKLINIWSSRGLSIYGKVNTPCIIIFNLYGKYTYGSGVVEGMKYFPI